MSQAIENLKIASWNINGFRAHLGLLKRWLAESQPDIVLLQETKMHDDAIPYDAIEDIPYAMAFWGQRKGNGVAILSRFPLSEIYYGIGKNTTEARSLQAVTAGLCVLSLYVPNGSDLHHPFFEAKRHFFDDITDHLASLKAMAFIAGGDYNVAPTPWDCPQGYDQHLLCSPEERRWLRHLILKASLCDALEMSHPLGKAPATWWDYRSHDWKSNQGWRLDHLLLSTTVADRLIRADVDTQVRGWPQSSDHAPVWVEVKKEKSIEPGIWMNDSVHSRISLAKTPLN